jgi:hypothetical protein
MTYTYTTSRTGTKFTSQRADIQYALTVRKSDGTYQVRNRSYRYPNILGMRHAAELTVAGPGPSPFTVESAYLVEAPA